MLIDTHAHIMVPAFDKDRDAVIRRAREAGVECIIAIGMDIETSLAAIALAEQYDGVHATVGIHPSEVPEASPEDFERIEALAGHPGVVGIGETGLDFYWDTSRVDRQKEYFRKHIQLARKVGKPVIVHDRDAHDAVLTVLDTEKTSEAGVILHCFTGDQAMAKTAVAAGYHVSFGGIVTFKKATIGDVVRQVPIDKLLLETDAPYLSPHPYRGKRNEPARVVHTAVAVALYRDMPVDELADTTTANACTLFDIPI